MSTTMDDGLDALSFDDKLKLYYGRLFPFDLMYEWLSYSGPGAASGANSSEIFSKRELSFTLKDDIYIRYLSYSDANEWKQDMLKRIPHKIDMGAVYAVPPKQKSFASKDSFKEVEREFILDIDLTDYQDDGTIQTNCVDPSDPEFKKSFRFMALAVRILDRALREDFGFQHLLWVFSGRRGIHCWVCDKRARDMNNTSRTAVVDYLNIFKGTGARLWQGGEKDKTKLAATGAPLHPALRRAFEEDISPVFESMVEEQGWFDSPERWAKVLELLPQEARDAIAERWSEKRTLKWTGLQRWDDLVKELGKGKSRGKGDPRTQLMFALAYPRLDVNVSKMMNHLLKSPFCIHPKTQRLCVPLDPAAILDFDPGTVPSLDDLLRDLNTAAPAGESKRSGAMEAHREAFRRTFLRGLSAAVAAGRRAAAQASHDF